MAGLIAKTSSENFNSGNSYGLQNNLMRSNFFGVNNGVAKQQTFSKTINTQNTPRYTQSPFILTAPSTYSGSKNLQFRPAIFSSVNSAANRATNNFSISKPAVSSLSAPKFSAGSKYYSASPKTSAQIKSGPISYKSAPYYYKTYTGKIQNQNKLPTQSTNFYSSNFRAASQGQPNSSSYLKSSSVNSYSNLSAGRSTANLQRPYSNQRYVSSPVNNYIRRPNINKDTTQSAGGANILGQQSVINKSGVNINTSTIFSENSPVNNDVINVSGNKVFVGVDI